MPLATIELKKSLVYIEDKNKFKNKNEQKKYLAQRGFDPRTFGL
jgi:hypothetical protein